jgi:hypothetical protein
MIGDCAPAPQGQQGHIISPSALANKNSFCMPVVKAALCVPVNQRLPSLPWRPAADHYKSWEL